MVEGVREINCCISQRAEIMDYMCWRLGWVLCIYIGLCTYRMGIEDILGKGFTNINYNLINF